MRLIVVVCCVLNGVWCISIYLMVCVVRCWQVVILVSGWWWLGHVIMVIFVLLCRSGWKRWRFLLIGLMICWLFFLVVCSSVCRLFVIWWCIWSWCLWMNWLVGWMCWCRFVCLICCVVWWWSWILWWWLLFMI